MSFNFFLSNLSYVFLSCVFFIYSDSVTIFVFVSTDLWYYFQWVIFLSQILLHTQAHALLHLLILIFFLVCDFVFSLLHASHFFRIFSLCLKSIQCCWYETCLKELDFYLNFFLAYCLAGAERKTRDKWYRTGKNRISGTGKSVLLKVNLGEHWVACNFVLLVALGGTHVCLTVYFAMHQMK